MYYYYCTIHYSGVDSCTAAELRLYGIPPLRLFFITVVVFSGDIMFRSRR